MISPLSSNNVFASFQLVTRTQAAVADSKSSSSPSASGVEDKITLSAAAQQAAAKPAGDVDSDGDNR